MEVIDALEDLDFCWIYGFHVIQNEEKMLPTKKKQIDFMCPSHTNNSADIYFDFIWMFYLKFVVTVCHVYYDVPIEFVAIALIITIQSLA